MVSALDSRASGSGSIPSRERCVVFLGKTLHTFLKKIIHFMHQNITIPYVSCTTYKAILILFKIRY